MFTLGQIRHHWRNQKQKNRTNQNTTASNVILVYKHVIIHITAFYIYKKKILYQLGKDCQYITEAYIRYKGYEVYLQKIFFSKYTTADEWVGGQQIEYCYWCDEEKKNTLRLLKTHALLFFSKCVYKAEKKIVSPYW